MAPRREKVEKASGDQGAALILDYLRKQNRPYSATDVSTNLHNKVSKAVAAKFLKEMHERRKIESRAAGKQLVYHALQDTADETSSEELHAMDENIAALRDERATLKAREKGSRSELSAFGSVVSTTALSTNVSALEVEETALEGRLATLHAAGNKAVSNEEKAAVEATWNTWQKHAATRKKICREMWERCLEALPEGQTKEQHWESLGLEGDLP